MSQKQVQLQELSSDLVHLYFEEHNVEKLKDYLSESMSCSGTGRTAYWRTLQEVRQNCRKVIDDKRGSLRFQDERCDIVYQKPEFAVSAYSCTLLVQEQGMQERQEYICISIVWDKEAEGWKICHIHSSIPDESLQHINCDHSCTEASTLCHIQNQHCDTLTQIFNLEGFVEQAQQILRDTDQQYALFKFGISDFRFINQIHGYAFGDDVLKCIARNLNSFCQEGEFCARIEKDTFAALLYFTNSDEFHKRLHNIRERLLDKHIASCLKHSIQYIGGVYLVKDTYEESIKSMLDKAVLAMQYVERSSRVSDFLYFEDWMLDQKNRSSELLEEAVRAMREDTFQLYIQPQFQLCDNKVIAGEALSRWFLEDGSIVSPDEFITLFEKQGMISSFDFYVLHKLCRIMRQWLNEGKQLLPISINQSRIHIKERNYLQSFCAIVDSYAIPHELIVFELTESAFTDSINDLQVIMKEIHEAGFQIAIDDFGTGYAGIGMLSQVDADILKLDKSMLNGINTDRRQMTIFWKIIEMAHSIGMQVICEGIETKEQFTDLKMLRCDMGQGFLISRAIPADQFAENYL